MFFDDKYHKKCELFVNPRTYIPDAIWDPQSTANVEALGGTNRILLYGLLKVS